MHFSVWFWWLLFVFSVLQNYFSHVLGFGLAFVEPSGQQYDPLVYQPLLSAWHYQQTGPKSRSFMKMFNRVGPNTDPWGKTLFSGFQLDFVPLIAALRSTIQPVFTPPHCLLIWPILHQLLYEDFIGGNAKIDNIHGSTLIYQAKYFIIGYQVDQA